MTQRRPGRGSTRAEEPGLGERAQAGSWKGKWVGVRRVTKACGEQGVFRRGSGQVAGQG